MGAINELTDAQLNVYFEHDRLGPFWDLTRAEQRRVENELNRQVKVVIGAPLGNAWMHLPSTLTVMVHGQQVTLRPDDESMSEANLQAYIDQELRKASDPASDFHTPNGDALRTNSRGGPLAICLIKWDGTHRDRTCIPLMIRQPDGRWMGWIVGSRTASGFEVRAWVCIELSYLTPDPRAG